MSIIEEIKKSRESKKLVIGTNSVIKSLKKDLLKKVVISNNCEKGVAKEIEKYKGDCEKVEYPGSNMDMGTICRRPHSISVIGILKD